MSIQQGARGGEGGGREGKGETFEKKGKIVKKSKEKVVYYGCVITVF